MTSASRTGIQPGALRKKQEKEESKKRCAHWLFKGKVMLGVYNCCIAVFPFFLREIGGFSLDRRLLSRGLSLWEGGK